VKMLIVEDDFISRKLLKDFLSAYGECDIAVDGREAVQAFEQALDEDAPYDLVCMDILMPHLDGQAALKQIRKIESEKGLSGPAQTKVIMTTAFGDSENVVEAFFEGAATSYLIKPIHKRRLLEEVRKLGLIS
jgi:two-component system chemotaxis response regulator CheY